MAGERAGAGSFAGDGRGLRTLIALAIAAAYLFAAGSSARAEVIAIEGATIHVAPGTTIKNGTLIIRDGKIDYVGQSARVPANAVRIAGKGKVVTAGLVEASTRIGVVEVSAVGPTQEGRFGNGNGGINAAYRIEDGYNATSVYIPVARTGGLTGAISTPHGGLVAGTSAWFALSDGARGTSAAIKAPLAMYATLGDGALGNAHGSRGMAIKRLRELLDDAAVYAKRRNNYERNQTRRFAASRLDLDALQPVLTGRVPLVVRAHRSSDILAALRVATQLKLRLVIEGGTEAHLVAKQLAAARVPVILNPTHNLPGSFERIHVVNNLATRLVKAGVRVAISTLGDASNARTLRQLAGIAVANGLPWERALDAVTNAPAEIFGVRDRGTLKTGSAADVVVWSGDPFELSTRAEQVFIGGVRQSLRTRQTRLLERYRRLIGGKPPTAP